MEKVLKHPLATDVGPVANLETPYIPATPVKRLAREELKKIIQSGNEKQYAEFEVSPKLIGIKEVIKGKNIGIRDIPNGVRIKPEDI